MKKAATDGFIRDQNNPGAVLNSDNNSLLAYKRMKNRNKEIDALKTKVDNIENMLGQILEKLNK
jgi:hypothetical protein